MNIRVLQESVFLACLVCSGIAAWRFGVAVVNFYLDNFHYR